MNKTFPSMGKTDVHLLVFAAFFVNALIFVVLVSDPLLIADAWYSLDVFIRQAYDGQLGIGDFFVQRAGIDHALPLNNLVLLIELKWFRLSLLPQAVIGLFCAGLCAYLLYRLIQREEGEPDYRANAGLMWLVMACALISLNSTGIWIWPLVALGFMSLVFVFWFYIALWNALNTGRYVGLAVSAFLLAAVADDKAVLAGAAALLAVIGFGWKRRLRQGWWRAPIVFTVAIGAVQVLIDVFGPVVGGEGGTAPAIGQIVRLFLREGWWHWPVLALSNSVISEETLTWIDATHVFQWQVALAVILAGLHLWFWWCFLRARATGTVFVAVCLMLLFYASVAGIAYGRVGAFGSDYLNQPRYVELYQLNLVALALMCVGGGRQPGVDSWPKALRRLQPGIGLALVFLVLQVAFVKHAWHTAPYIRLYYWKMAEQTVAMAKNPEVTPPGCAPELPICGMSPQQRSEILVLLQKHNLNVFNDKFRAMHGFPPDWQ